MHGLGELVLNDKGEPIKMFGTVQDITEHKLAEDLLAKNEKRFRELYQNSPLGYQSLDAEGCFIESNPSLCWMLGYERHEMVGMWFGDFLTHVSAKKFKLNFPRFKAKGAVHAVPFDMVTKDGRIISVEIDGRISTSKSWWKNALHSWPRHWSGPKPPARPRALSWPTGCRAL